MLLGLLANKLCFLRSQEFQDLLGQCPDIGTGDAQDTGSCMPPMLKIPYHKSKGSLFTSALLHNFTLVKVKKVCLTGWLFYIL